MASMTSLAARALAATACLSLTATPVLAAALPAVAQHRTIEAPRTWSPADDRAADRGGWGRGGWGGHHGHHDDGIDAGDVFAGILILGGIAAIASAASSHKDKNADDEYRYREPDNRGSDYRAPTDRNWDQSRGASRAMNDAVDACAGAASGQGDVSDIYGVQRTGNGYQVSGKLANGDEFACTTGSDGRVDDLSVDGRTVVSSDFAPAPQQQGDDRYDTAAAPDFEDGAGS